MSKLGLPNPAQVARMLQEAQTMSQYEQNKPFSSDKIYFLDKDQMKGVQPNTVHGRELPIRKGLREDGSSDKEPSELIKSNKFVSVKYGQKKVLPDHIQERL